MNNLVDAQPRRGWLKNGNTPGNPDLAPRCGARTRKGHRCKAPAMENGRCRMHGGSSTGPRTQQGLARSKLARWKHGFYSARERASRGLTNQILKDSKELLKKLNVEDP